MKTIALGNSGIQITPVLMGTWQAGRRGWVDIDDDAIVAGLRAAFDAGITTFDTAEIYGDGYSETLVGKALTHVRDRIVYATKVFPTHLKFDQVMTACEDSLRRLQTDYIDLYQIHWPAGAFKSDIVPLSETMSALTQLKEQGKIRAIGVSNFSRSQLEEAAQYGRIDSIQPPYNLFWRQFEQDARPYCLEHNMTVLAYSSMAQGLLTGKFDRSHQFPDADVRSTNRLFQGETYQKAQDALDRLREIAAAYNCTLGQLALAWVMAQPNTCAIAGARNAEQVSQNAVAATIELSSDDLQRMDAISQTVIQDLDANPVMWKLAS